MGHGGHLVFQNDTKNVNRQCYMITKLSCKFEKPSYFCIERDKKKNEEMPVAAISKMVETFCASLVKLAITVCSRVGSRGKKLNAHGGHFVFPNEANILLRHLYLNYEHYLAVL